VPTNGKNRDITFCKEYPRGIRKLTTTLFQAGINIDALTIQDASQYVQELFRGRGNPLKGLPLLPAMDQ